MVKNVDGNNLGNVWEKVAELVKKLTGDVELPKGNLQEQILNHTHDNRYYTENEIDEKLGEKLLKTGDSKDLTTTFTSQDSTNVTQWTDVGVLQSGEKHSSMFQKISTMFKNIRYLYHMLGTADISTLGEGADIGTVTGALSKLNSDCNAVKSIIVPSEYAYKNVGFAIRKIGQVKIIEIDGFDVTKINVAERITIGTITDPEYYCHGTFVKDLFYVTSDGTRFKIRINLTDSCMMYLYISECTIDDLPKLAWANICGELIYI